MTGILFSILALGPWQTRLEAPAVMSGVGFGTASRQGAAIGTGAAVGTTLGDASVFAVYRYRSTLGDRPQVGFQGTSGRERMRVNADWRAHAVGIEGQYPLAAEWHGISPYVSASLGIAVSGYTYFFGDSDDARVLTGSTSSRERCTEDGCRAPTRRARSINPFGAIGAGGAWQLHDWLRASAGLSFEMYRNRSKRVSETITAREVRGVSEAVLVLAFVFGVQFSV